jgi:hypothetical protein
MCWNFLEDGDKITLHVNFLTILDEHFLNAIDINWMMDKKTLYLIAQHLIWILEGDNFGMYTHFLFALVSTKLSQSFPCINFP